MVFLLHVEVANRLLYLRTDDFLKELVNFFVSIICIYTIESEESFKRRKIQSTFFMVK